MIYGDAMRGEEVQGELFGQTKPVDHDQESFKEFLKMVFRACERVYSSRVVREAFSEWEIEKEIEKEMEIEAERRGIEEENDF